MKESTRLQFQQHYLGVCRERGWLDRWDGDLRVRALRARARFGLEVVYGTDGAFADAREELGAEHLSATVDPEEAQTVLRGLSLKHQETDEDGQPDPATEVLLNPGDSDLEMFQEANVWKEEFGLGTAIGRRR
jgi:hypothetical protein